jgi:hypothetical protein
VDNLQKFLAKFLIKYDPDTLKMVQILVIELKVDYLTDKDGLESLWT